MPTIFFSKRKKRDSVVTINNKLLHKWYNNRKWRKLRQRKIIDSPLCEACLQKVPPVISTAAEVHHRIPIDINNPDRELIYSWENLICLCIPCHKQAHQVINAPKRKTVKTWREVKIPERK